ncbi:MAG: FKBP-type peptidyl-prolyl cis-trans isomerase, partial [Bacteroidales bacterium]
SGAYLITNKKGVGKQVKETSAVFVRHSTLDLKNNYEQTSVEEIAKNVGGFSYGAYYGPVLFEMGNYSMMTGIEEAFIELREGSDVRIIVPSWASKLKREESENRLSFIKVYDIEIIKVIDDYSKYEIDTLVKFSNINYGGLDSLRSGFYFKSLKEGAGDSIKAESHISYNYVGRLLNGFVFDTNIEDTARKYKIYSSEKAYSPVNFKVTPVGGSGDSGEATVVDGFAMALLNMKYGGKAITFFGSEWGYGAASQSFGKKQQLHFYIEILDKEE